MNPDEEGWVELGYAQGQILSFSSTTTHADIMAWSDAEPPKWEITVGGGGGGQAVPVSVQGSPGWHVQTWSAGGGNASLPKEKPDLVHQCWHCSRDRHDGPLTGKVAHMWEHHHWDENYDPDHDASPIVCLGSDAIGPARAVHSSGRWIPSEDEQAAMVDQMQSAIVQDDLEDHTPFYQKVQNYLAEELGLCQHANHLGDCAICAGMASLTADDEHYHFVSKEVYTFDFGHEPGKYVYVNIEEV